MAKFFGYQEFHYNFLGHKKLWYVIAMAAIIPGMLVLLFAGMNMGIDFTGGSIIKVQYQQAVELADVREAVSAVVTHTPAVNESDNNGFTIRTESLTDDDSAVILDSLSQLGEFVPQSTYQEFIGPTIGGELLAKARWALLIAAAFMLIYITFRFKLNHALTAVATLIHDVLVMLSFFAIFRVEINSYFVAAILTIVGYSINNTIVIFDRIRENESYHLKLTRAELINTSINQTLTRTFNTILAVLILLMALYFFGGETMTDFMLALIVGILAGFFSSVFLVGCLLNDLDAHTANKRRKVGASSKRKLSKSK